MNDDDELSSDEVAEEEDDVLVPGSKKPKKIEGDDSLDELADEEEVALPEDNFDDQDLW